MKKAIKVVTKAITVFVIIVQFSGAIFGLIIAIFFILIGLLLTYLTFNASEIDEGLGGTGNITVLFYIVVITIALALFAGGIYQIYQIKKMFNKKTYEERDKGKSSWQIAKEAANRTKNQE